MWVGTGSVANVVREHSQVGTFLGNFGYRVANCREFPCGNRD